MNDDTSLRRADAAERRSSVGIEGTRVSGFFERLADAIPCDPEDARADLHAAARWELLSRYLNWADRIIAPRPRRVLTWDGFRRYGKADQRWDAICALAAEIEAGNDLRPYLSDRVARSGYVRAGNEGKRGARGVEWADKDYALNAFETHHLHLDRTGTEELLYVSFSRKDAFFLMVGDHKSFDDGSLAQAVAETRVGTSYELKGVAPPHQRTMNEYNQLQRRGFATFYPVGDQLVMGATLSTAGTSWLHARHAQRILKVLKETDPRIAGPEFGRDWFEQIGQPYPTSPNFEWAMNYCDLCLLETTAFLKVTVLEWRR
jgi:hypothetical protein